MKNIYKVGTNVKAGYSDYVVTDEGEDDSYKDLVSEAACDEAKNCSEMIEMLDKQFKEEWQVTTLFSCNGSKYVMKFGSRIDNMPPSFCPVKGIIPVERLVGNKDTLIEAIEEFSWYLNQGGTYFLNTYEFGTKMVMIRKERW